MALLAEISRSWRIRYQRYRLEGTRCKDCGAIHYPPRLICDKCHSRNLEPFPLSGKGEVISYAVLLRGPTGFDVFTPYIYAMVRLEEGPIVEGQLTDVDPEEVEIGMKVEMVTRKLMEYGKDGLIIYGYKFRPLMR